MHTHLHSHRGGERERESLTVTQQMGSTTEQIGSKMNPQNFQEYCIQWREEQTTQLRELISVSKLSNHPPSRDLSMCGLVNRVISHYEEFYKIKSKWVESDVLLILSPPWYTPLEDSFRWIGGWRPSTVFHLLYSKSGLQLEAKITQLTNDVGYMDNYDLGDLSSDQLVSIDTLQRRTIHEERKITEEMAKQQEKVADAEMVELSHEMSESIRVDDERVDTALKPKEEGLQKILGGADDLRLRTLKGVIEILSPIQAIHFLIAAAELQLRLHDWGKEKEKKKARSDAVSNG